MKDGSARTATMTEPAVCVSVVEIVAERARECFGRARGSHDWDHTLRVADLCRRIGEKEGADMDVLLMAAYLHDTGRTAQDESHGRVCHAAAGAEIAGRLLSDLPVEPARRDNVVHCVRTHRFRGGLAPETLEAKVLFDADKLDAIGAVGVARAFLFAGEVGARLHNPDADPETTKPYGEDDTGYREYIVKLQKVKDRILTQEGRRMAVERHDFMTAFFERFLDEYQARR